jgi:hypothetical protein
MVWPGMGLIIFLAFTVNFKHTVFEPLGDSIEVGEKVACRKHRIGRGDGGCRRAPRF